MESSQVPIPRPLTKERVERALAQVEAIHEEMRRDGIDPRTLADPVEMLRQLRDAPFDE